MADRKGYKTEALKNLVVNRFQLNFKKNVGPTSESIRRAQPRSREEWEEYYYTHVRTREDIANLGSIMYAKIHEDILPAFESITEAECQRYLQDLVIGKTFDGYMTEIGTIRRTLAGALTGVTIESAPDDWDRTLAVNFFIRVGSRLIGLQVKPVTADLIPDLHRWQAIWQKGHEEFSRQFGGKVFTVYGEGSSDAKHIRNPEIVQEIKAEIQRLRGL
jgi:hypothetical protein